MAAIPGMVRVSGKARPRYSPDDCEQPAWEDFEIVSAVIKKTRQDMDSGEDGADGADVNFFACLEDCATEESCKRAADEGLDLCPSTDKPEHYDAYLGAKVNSIVGVERVGVTVP